MSKKYDVRYWSKVSIDVGWEYRQVSIPTLEDVENATAFQLVEWNRFLTYSQSVKMDSEILDLLHKKIWNV